MLLNAKRFAALTASFLPLMLILASPTLVFRASAKTLIVVIVYSVLHAWFTQRPRSPIISKQSELLLYILAVPTCLIWAFGVMLLNEGSSSFGFEVFLRAVCLVGLPVFMLARYSAVDLLKILIRLPYGDFAVELYSRIERTVFSSSDALIEAFEISATFRPACDTTTGRAIIVSELLVANLLEQVNDSSLGIHHQNARLTSDIKPPIVGIHFSNSLFVFFVLACLFVL